MPRALIIGGTGPIGRATGARLLAAGWQVDLTGRDPAGLPATIAAAGGRFIPADRDDTAQLAAAFGDGADLLVDCLCYTAMSERAGRRRTAARLRAGTGCPVTNSISPVGSSRTAAAASDNKLVSIWRP